MTMGPPLQLCLAGVRAVVVTSLAAPYCYSRRRHSCIRRFHTRTLSASLGRYRFHRVTGREVRRKRDE